MRGTNRRPTLKDGGVVYANATILGGDVVGRDSVIGSNVWPTKPLAPRSRSSSRNRAWSFEKTDGAAGPAEGGFIRAAARIRFPLPLGAGVFAQLCEGNGAASANVKKRANDGRPKTVEPVVCVGRSSRDAVKRGSFFRREVEVER
ncbi:MAG: hypothetical protein IKU86_01415, partial [Thermoguttaceae bacterium]|nr:hypothetical protein [Thermoguttaceae bacterium]